ncbi:MAG: hypothetical protein QGI86_17795 [Candidatus Poribacteria bacterium]|jgi:hypothetical protein|nr:hypothetical protein [Candidatus Poribacteria bacterium]MDP6749498.1 hypothetical protein [Candidatus Poribacteria bacterium]MDP6999040.1 hypothetical protein [Candidatus Poribacteria bacterium]
MKTIQLSLQVADEITSIDQLEPYVDHLGQQIKHQLLINMLTQFDQSKSHSDSTQSTCPNCQKTGSYTRLITPYTSYLLRGFQ